MLLMMAEVLHFRRMAERFEASRVWQFLADCQTHVAWTGCSPHDLIQPSFAFLVGVALPFSLASRTARGQSTARMALHAVWRSVALVALGIALRYWLRPARVITFEDTLTQIGLGYVPLFFLGRARNLIRFVALIAILVGYWALFALRPLPGADFDWGAVGVPPDWSYHFSEFAAHWNKNANPAWAFDVWFLNLFPRAAAFTHNAGGYTTLNFIPTLGTMILGLFAGSWLMADASARSKVGRLLLAGVATLSIGLFLDAAGICPAVKRIWTPSWVLVSGGACFLILAGLFTVIDWAELRRWTMPLCVIGANSIAAYVLAEWTRLIVIPWLISWRWSGFAMFGAGFEPLFAGAVLLTADWLVLYLLYRRRIYLRI